MKGVVGTLAMCQRNLIYKTNLEQFIFLIRTLQQTRHFIKIKTQTRHFIEKQQLQTNKNKKRKKKTHLKNILKTQI